MLVLRNIVGAVRVHDSFRKGQLLRHLMMIGYNELHSKLSYVLCLRDGGNTVIYGNDKPGALLLHKVDGGDIQSVALVTGGYVP